MDRWETGGKWDLRWGGEEEGWDGELERRGLVLRDNGSGGGGSGDGVGRRGGDRIGREGRRGRNGEEGSWTRDMELGVRVAEEKLRADHRKSEELGRRMWDVWKRERELWWREREERRARKRSEKLERKFGGQDTVTE